MIKKKESDGKEEQTKHKRDTHQQGHFRVYTHTRAFDVIKKSIHAKDAFEIRQ